MQIDTLCWSAGGKDDSCRSAVLDQDLSLMNMMLLQALWAHLSFGLVAVDLEPRESIFFQLLSLLTHL